MGEITSTNRFINYFGHDLSKCEIGDRFMNDSSFHPHANGESSEDTNSKRMVDNLSQSNQQLLQTIDKLRAEIVKLQLFINIAAHELKTPIMPILVFMIEQ
jgi:signal transduction histidine kinase